MTRRAPAAHSLPTHRDLRATRRSSPVQASDRGASAVEYGLMLAAITAVIAIAVFAFGGIVNQTFEDSTACLSYTGVGEPDC